MADKFIQLVDTQGNAFAVRVDELGDGSFATVSVSPALPTGGTISGQVASVAGSATQGPSISLINGVMLRAHPSNSGNVVVGNAGGTVSLITGVPLSAGAADLWQVQNLNELWFIGAGTVAWHA